MSYLKEGVEGSIMMSNEARRKLDLPDAEGGDVLLANGNVIPLTQAGAAYLKGGQTEAEETDEPEQPEEQTEPDAEQPDENEPDETDEAEDEETEEGGE